MRIGWQEIIALTIVIAVVAFALWRRWRRGAKPDSACGDCSNASASTSDEKPVHIYRRQD